MMECVEHMGPHCGYPSWGLLKNLDVGGFAFIPAKAGMTNRKTHSGRDRSRSRTGTGACSATAASLDTALAGLLGMRRFYVFFTLNPAPL